MPCHIEAKRDEITRLLNILKIDTEERCLRKIGKKLDIGNNHRMKPETALLERLKTLELLKSNITSAEDAGLFAQEVGNGSIYLRLVRSDRWFVRESRLYASTPLRVRIPKMEHLRWH